MQVVADIETDSLDATTIHLLGIQDLDTGEYRDYFGDTLQEGLRVLLDAELAVFHNGNTFDILVIERLHGVRFNMERVIDTLLLSRIFRPERDEHGLESWGKTFGLPKGDFKDFAGGVSDEMRKYCRRDVELTARVFNHLMPDIDQYTNAFLLEQEVARIIVDQHRHGFRLNEPEARRLVEGYRVRIDSLREQLLGFFPTRPLEDKMILPLRDTEESTKGAIYTRLKWNKLNPNSRPQMLARFEAERGWTSNVVTKNGNKSLSQDVLEACPVPEAKVAWQYYDLTKQSSQVENWLKFIRNGRIHGVVSTCGARTGRMTHSKPNSANIDKRDFLRALWIASPGKVLVDCDAEGLEARGLAHYIAPSDGGALAIMVDQGDKKKGTDIHTSNQKAVGLYFRDSAKTLLYALIYGSGVENLGEIFYRDCMLAGQAGNMGKVNLMDLGSQAKRSLMTNIVGLQDLDQQLKKEFHQKGFLIGLDGRKIIPAADYTCLNTMIQHSGAVLMKRSLVIFDQKIRDNRLEAFHLANVHDEFMVECDPEIAPTIAQLAQDAIHEAGLYYDFLCPLRGEAKIGTNWSEVH